MQAKIDKMLQTEILVIGGSGAGVTAAIAAHRSGKDVLLVCKGKVGRSGNAIMAGGGFGVDGESARNIVGEVQANPAFTREKYFDNVLKEGFFLSEQDILQQFVDESPAVVKELFEWGKKDNVRFDFSPPSNWRSAGISWGRCVKRGLLETPGIKVLEDTTAVELLKEGDRISGALAIDIYTGEILLIKAKAVVLATGGFQPSGFKNTVTDMTGDGAAMAYRAGAKLADMEFLLAFPTANTPTNMRGSIYPFLLQIRMRELNIRILDKDKREIEIPKEVMAATRNSKLSKLCSDYYWGHAIAAGRGGPNGGVFMDFSENDKQLRIKNIEQFMQENAIFYPKGCYKGDNMDDICQKIIDGEPFEVGLGYEYSMGGVLIDSAMRTGIKGLFAGGEAGSGVFGACRAGDGLTEMLGQGYRSGLSAAQYSEDADYPQIDNEQLEALTAKILCPLQNQCGPSPFAAQAELEQACDAGFGVIRNEKGLSQALKIIVDIKQRLPKLATVGKSRRYNYEWLTALQVENLQTCVEAGVRAALMRKESRGCHIRSDYGQVNHDGWCVRIIHENVDGVHTLSTKKPNVTSTPLPTGTEDSVMDYFLSKKTNYSPRGR